MSQTLSSCHRVTKNLKKSNLLSLALYRSFSRSAMGLRLPQNNPPSEPGSGWVNVTCMAVAALGLGFSFFSTRQLCDDPKRRALWKK